MDMKNKIVIFSNIKGGVGKTTLCALFANHLIEHGFPSFVIDADLQASLFRHRQREKDAAPDAQIPWNVEMLDTSDHKRLVQVMGKLKEVPGIVLIDCPGNLNDRNLAYIYQSADTAIIPISFDADTVDATGIFVKALKSVSSAGLIFIPNRINAAERKAEEIRQREQTIGYLLNRLSIKSSRNLILKNKGYGKEQQTGNRQPACEHGTGRHRAGHNDTRQG